MSDTQHPSRRAAERVRAFEPTHYIIEGFGEEQGVITNLSVKGCFIQPGTQDAERGRVITVRVYLPVEPHSSALPVWLQGSVAYYLPRVGIGVHFDVLSPEQRAGLERLVDFYRTVTAPRPE